MGKPGAPPFHNMDPPDRHPKPQNPKRIIDVENSDQCFVLTLSALFAAASLVRGDLVDVRSTVSLARELITEVGRVPIGTAADAG